MALPKGGGDGVQPDTTQLLIKPHYMPCVAYLQQVARHADLCLEVCAFYARQTYQNRGYISTSQGVERLIVPVQYVGSKQLYKDTKIDYAIPWHVKHRRTLTTAYGNAPYYHALADMLYPILERKPTFLLDLSAPLMEALFRFLGLAPRITLTTQYMATSPKHTLDLRDRLHPKKRDAWVQQVPRYRHLFAPTFIPNLSVVDLLFCEGPDAREQLV